MAVDTRTKILNGAIQSFNKYGLKLTMDDVAEEISISKKTIYKEFTGKEELFEVMVDYVFDGIKERENEILSMEGIETIDRIRLLLSAMPGNLRNIKFQDMDALKDKYPKIYKKIQNRLETGWESAFELLELGKKEGVIRENADLMLFKTMMDASLEKLFEKNTIRRNKKTYNDILNEVVDVLLTGIAV